MSRDEYVQYLLDCGCLIQKKGSNGMWIIYNEATKKRAPIPVTDPALDANICRVCEALGVDLPDDSEVYRAKAQLIEFHQQLVEKEK